jgi:glutathionylspermidine synthase
MQRRLCEERPHWREFAEEYGFTFHTLDGDIYWDETAHYEFTLEQVEEDLEAATSELHTMALELVDEAIRDERLLRLLAIPQRHWDLLRASWQRRDPSMYARMDLSYGGGGPPKLYELNYDTPTCLYESAFFQWVWLEDLRLAGQLPARADQFNSVQDKLEEFFRKRLLRPPVHFAAVGQSEEDCATVSYLCDLANQAGCAGRFVSIEEIGLTETGQFVDDEDFPIVTLFKLYPWEDLLEEPYAEHLGSAATRFVEPPWKLILSNKAALALLWERHPGHPNLLPTFFDDKTSALPPGWVRKPFFSREGANVEIHEANGNRLEVTGPYSRHPVIRQLWHPLPRFGDRYPVIGSWIVGDEPAGMGIREDFSPITQNRSRFVPHIILD